MHPGNEDKKQIREMWKRIFKDDDAFMDEYFGNLYDEAECYVMKKGESVITFVDMIELQIRRREERKKAVYVFGVMTAEEERGKGLCRELMEEAERQSAMKGCEYAILVAAEDGLVEMYEKMGYKRIKAREREWDYNEAFETYQEKAGKGWRIVAEEKQYETVRKTCRTEENGEVRLMIKRLKGEETERIEEMVYERGMLMEV